MLGEVGLGNTIAMAEQGTLAAREPGGATGEDESSLQLCQTGRFRENNVLFRVPWNLTYCFYAARSTLRTSREEMRVAFKSLAPRIQWWWLSLGQRVYSLAMGRFPEIGDRGVYPRVPFVLYHHD